MVGETNPHVNLFKTPNKAKTKFGICRSLLGAVRAHLCLCHDGKRETKRFVSKGLFACGVDFPSFLA